MVVNKKMRRAEIIAGVFFMIVFSLDLYGKIRSAVSYDSAMSPLRVVYSVSDLLFPPLLILGKYRDKPWNFIGGALLILSASCRVRYVVDAFRSVEYSSGKLRCAAILFCYLLLLTVGVTAALTLCGFIRWRNRNRLLTFMYIVMPLSIIQVFFLSNYMDVFCMFAVVLCLFHDNRHVNTKQGRTGRAALYVFAVLRLVYFFTAYIMFVIGALIHMDLSSAYSQVMSASGVLVMFMYAMTLLIPQMLFDKQIGSDIVYGDMYLSS